MFAPAGSVESRRKIVGFKPTEFASDEVMRQTRRDLETGIMAGEPCRYGRARRAPGSRSNDVGHCRREPRGAAGRISPGIRRVTMRVESRCRSGSTSKTWTPQWLSSTPCTPDSRQKRSPARRLSGGRELPSAPASAQTPVIELDTALRTSGLNASRQLLIEATGTSMSGCLHPRGVLESRRKIVGFTPIDIPFDDLQT